MADVRTQQARERVALDERWVLRATAQEPPAAPCYVCGHPVAEGEGWRRDSKTWCPDHRPVWSHD